MDLYWTGFGDSCARAGVDPAALVKTAEEGDLLAGVEGGVLGAAGGALAGGLGGASLLPLIGLLTRRARINKAMKHYARTGTLRHRLGMYALRPGSKEKAMALLNRRERRSRAYEGLAGAMMGAPAGALIGAPTGAVINIEQNRE